MGDEPEPQPCELCECEGRIMLEMEYQCIVTSPQCGTCDKFEKACSGGLITHILTEQEVGIWQVLHQSTCLDMVKRDVKHKCQPVKIVPYREGKE